jgi:hypothetical protein
MQLGSPGAEKRGTVRTRYVAALAVLLSATLAASSARAEEFTSELPISAAGVGAAVPYPSPITVSGMTGAITDVNVRLDELHSNESDNLAMLVMAPNGQALEIADGAGSGATLSGALVTFDDSASLAIPSDLPISNGAFKPAAYYAGTSFPSPGPGTSYLNPGPAGGGSATLASAFNGGEPNGVWDLYLLVVTGPSTTALMNSWTLEITSEAPPSSGDGSPAAPGVEPAGTAQKKRKKCKKGKKRAAAAKKRHCRKKK